jgi:neopullulanase
MIMIRRTIQTPDWVKQAVFYQIFPDRFARSPRITHSRGIQFKPWGAPPDEQGYQGGDLFGIVDHLDYLAALGITALYLNPIFSAATNHRYNAFDYMEVDPLLGGKPALRDLLDGAHARGIKVVLDGVFNHSGRGFWPFHHIMENGGNSPYLDWFTVNRWPLKAYDHQKGSKPNYENWWGNASLPKLNTKNPGVRDYIMEVARYWLEFGIDGWRLDVPEEIDDDGFWREFRQVVKTANPEAYIVGEIWHEAKRWLQGDMFDAVMNYQFTSPAISFFGAADLNMTWRHQDVNIRPIDAVEFARNIDAMYALYDWEINHAQMNMLDSHDMPRLLWLVNENKPAMHLAVLCQMTIPGAPNIYYGDEIGLSAAGDPHCRAAFRWDLPETWDYEMKDFYTQAIALRRLHPVLSTGNFQFIYAADQMVAYRRSLGEQEALVVFNAGLAPGHLRLPAQALANTNYRSIWPASNQFKVSAADNGLALEMLPQSALVLINDFSG